jgi:hypothetical protein
MLRHPGAKPLLFVLCLLPTAWLFYGAWTDTLGANPADALIRATGTPKSRPASSISAKHSPLPRKARQAPAVISAPIPAGSPMVRISGFIGWF